MNCLVRDSARLPAETRNEAEHTGCKLEPDNRVPALALGTHVPLGRLQSCSAQFLHLFSYVSDSDLLHGAW